jgi:hypothetical protein
MLKNVFKTFTLILFIIAFSHASFGEDAGPAVKIISVTGEVIVLVSGDTDWSKADPGMALSPGTRLKTLKGSSAVLAFDEKTENRVKIQPESYIVLKLAAKEKIEIIDGTLLSVIKDLPAGSEFEIRTPLAVCGVRGTKYRISADQKTSSTALAVRQNTVSFTCSREPDKSVIVGKDQQREIAPWDKAMIRAKGLGLLSTKETGPMSSDTRENADAPEISKEEYLRKFGADAFINTERAATADAHRKLAGRIYGIIIDPKHSIDTYARKTPLVRKTVTGIVRGGTITETSYYSDGSIKVLMETEGSRVKNDLTPVTGDIFGRDCLSGPTRMKRSDFEEFLL